MDRSSWTGENVVIANLWKDSAGGYQLNYIFMIKL